MTTIDNIEFELEKALREILHGILPQTKGFALEVDLLENRRKKRSDASQESWKPANGEIRIKFTVPQSFDDVPVLVREHTITYTSGGVNDISDEVRVLGELITALSNAEQRPGFEFVSLKWFRDLYLPAQGFVWSDDRRRVSEVIKDAIDGGTVLSYKVPNPKNPAFPTTAIRTNRQHPTVLDVLGQAESKSTDFEPVAISGEPISETVLRNRR